MFLTQADLDELWDFADPAASEARFEAAAHVATGAERAVLETQRARALGLQQRYDDADAVLDAVAGDSAEVSARVALERGRLRNSSGDPDAAAPLFQRAAAVAASAGLTFVHVDALHMLAIADPPHAAEWSAQALAALDGVEDPRTLRWRVSLHNNDGWAHLDAGRYADARAAFERAKDAAVRWGTPQQLQWAEEALAAVQEAQRSA